ncbi:MAG: hypothetical protein J0G96_13095 [Flavobacteriia bacterium]|nr:hypothetical protein [Flavobacteriia bacterium]OJX34868.1 MAG: hypothetical protein BGO87_08980 [Flavobacteriia bacterium 40-80]
MRFFVLLFCALFILSCSPKKDITFDVTYELTAADFKIEDDMIVVRDYPLYFQSRAENNYSKKSQVKSIQLVKVSSDALIEPGRIKISNDSGWTFLTMDTIITENTQHPVFLIINSPEDLTPVFKEDKLNLHIPFDRKAGKIPTTLTLVFRFKGKHDKTNVQYRILA